MPRSTAVALLWGLLQAFFAAVLAAGVAMLFGLGWALVVAGAAGLGVTVLAEWAEGRAPGEVA